MRIGMSDARRMGESGSTTRLSLNTNGHTGRSVSDKRSAPTSGCWGNFTTTLGPLGGDSRTGCWRWDQLRWAMRTGEADSITLLPQLSNIANVARRGTTQPCLRDHHPKNDNAHDQAELSPHGANSTVLPNCPSTHFWVVGQFEPLSWTGGAISLLSRAPGRHRYRDRPER